MRYALGHMLSSCKEALDRFEWRHKYLLTTFSSQGLEGAEIYADLDGHRVNGVTIPPDLAMSAQKPDLVIIKRKTKEVKLIELTVPWDTTNNMASALQRKTTRYENLVAEINGNGYKCSNIPLEIGTRGVVHTSYLSREPRVYSCKFFLAGVNFYRFNAKNWQFTVYFAVITQKIGNLLCILS